MATPKSLDERLQSLPQELQDHIFQFVLDIEASVVQINHDYRPPQQLSINQATRKKVAQVYYGQTTFELPELAWSLFAFSGDTTTFATWMKYLSVEHALLIKRVHIALDEDGIREGPAWNFQRRQRVRGINALACHWDLFSRSELFHDSLRSALRVKHQVECADGGFEKVWETLDEITDRL